MSERAIDDDGSVRFTSAEFLRDPYPAYAWMREHAPVYFSEEWQGFAITRYADVMAAFRDPRLSAHRIPSGARTAPSEMQEKLAPVLSHLAHWALFADPPEHTRLRGLLNRAFVPRLVEGMRARFAKLVEGLVASLVEASSGGDLDVITGLAAPLPMLVIGEILGLPPEDRHALKPWSNALTAFLGGRTRSIAVLEETCGAIADLERYFRGHIARRRREPPEHEDLLSALMSAEDQGQLLSEDELIATCSLALFAGNETTADLIGSAVWLLTQHPDVQSALRRDAGLVPAFIEEALRLESPVQRTGRVAREDFELRGKAIRKGDRVWLMLGSANRDGAQFARPDALDLARPDDRPVSFGYGTHFCTGAALARMEAQLAVEELLRRVPAFGLAAEVPVRIDNLMVRGFKRLRVRPAGPPAAT